MTPVVAKIILYVVMFLSILGSLLSYKFINNEKAKVYSYVLSTISLIAAVSVVSIDGNIFSAEFPAKHYLIEMGIFLGVMLLGFIITLIVRLIIKSKNKA